MVANHLSWLDGFVLVLSSPRPLRMLVYGPNIRGRFLRMLSDQWRFILFEPRPKSIAQALRSVQEGLAAGDAVGIFSEGAISRTGQILGFRRGLDWVLGRVGAPIVPVHIDGMWGSVLSFSEGRFFRKWPRLVGGGWRRPLTVRFGRPLPVGTSPRDARFALQELTARGIRDRMLATRNARREIAAWLRRHAAGAGPLRAALDAVRGQGAGPPADPRMPDWAALAATAEAFEGGCQVRRDDRMVSSLLPDDPLAFHLGVCGGPLLGIAATTIEPGLTAQAMLDELVRFRATIWLARPGQVAAIAALPPERVGRLPEVIVIPVCEFSGYVAQRAITAIQAAHGVEPVVAFAPKAIGGLVSMNTPPSRFAFDEMVTCRPASLGRVVMGVVVWPLAADRARLGLEPLDGDAPEDLAAADASLVVAATGIRHTSGGGDGGRQPPSCLLRGAYLVDDHGFLFLPGTPAELIHAGEPTRGQDGGESRRSKSNLG